MFMFRKLYHLKSVSSSMLSYNIVSMSSHNNFRRFRVNIRHIQQQVGVNKSAWWMASRVAVWWRNALRRRPILTNTAVYASFYTAAEFSQQTFNKIYSPEKPAIDVVSAARIVSVGSCVYAPTLYFWYKFLDKKFAGTAVKTVAKKVAADQFIMTPVLLAAFYTLLGVLEGKKDVFEELREKYLKTFVANQAFWIPGQTINFFFVPPQLRVVYVASASFIWINVLCFIKRQKSGKSTEANLK